MALMLNRQLESAGAKKKNGVVCEKLADANPFWLSTPDKKNAVFGRQGTFTPGTYGSLLTYLASPPNRFRSGATRAMNASLRRLPPAERLLMPTNKLVSRGAAIRHHT